MLDIKRIRENPELLTKAVRGKDIDIDFFVTTDKSRRELLGEVENLKSIQNAKSKEIPVYKKEGKDTSELMIELKDLSDKIKVLDEKVREVDESLEAFILTIPNIPEENVPVGASDEDNREVRKVGTPREFDFEAKPHWDIGEDLGILDFATGAKVTGTRFTFYKGLGAKLERALINFMLDVHEKQNYTEVIPPFIANRASMTGTGQLPKFEDDAFKLYNNQDYFLIPTAEVPVTNMYRDEILDMDKLPIYHDAYSACFRAEAGAAGRDTRGLIRQHQFNKVEMVKFVTPETSYDELEKLTLDAEEILKLLGIPYRVVELCTGDLGFSSAKTYDIEVWMPSYNRYVEISSCSNFGDFQARRANIKFKRDSKSKAEFVHTLNGSGLAVGRSTACILETYQREDGSIEIPEVLRNYMGVDEIR